MTRDEPGTVVLVRHGETEWNREHRIQGHADSALTDEGQRQTELLAARLAGTKVDAVYSSDLGRALRAAEAIAKPHGLEAITDTGLRERGFGRWEGLTVDEAREDDAEALEMWYRDLENFRPPGAEGSKAMRERAWGTFRRSVEECAAGCIVLVSHSGPIRQILATALGVPWAESRRLRIANGSLTTLELRSDHIVLVTFSDTCHLEPAVHGA
ncbi:MAG: histidine phosphatase family protein [Armatimonadota bacterium]